MRRLTLIRHAVTDWNSTGKLQGHLDCPLSDEGRRQARLLGERVGESSVDLLYSSPLVRAHETARTAFPHREITVDRRVMELDFGEFQGRTPEENASMEEWQWWLEDPFARRAPGGESYGELRARAVEWFEELPRLPHIVAVTHSGTIQMLLSHIMGVEKPAWRKRIALRHSSISRLIFRGDDVLIERVNDTRHVKSNIDPFLD